jgi:hypothetical protein
MSFDPTKPVNGDLIDADELRGQLNALKALNDTLTATVASQAAQIAAQDIAISQRLKSSDAVLVFAASVAGLALDATAFDDPPTQGQVESLRDKVNELITRLQTV